jgi:DNA-binding PadR family transcriptional regulator
MDVETHLPLAPRDLLILAVLAEGPLHGYGIIKAVEERSQTGVLLDPANLYRVLRRMLRLGWIRQANGGEDGGIPGESGESTDTRRRVYVVTPHGKAILAAELARLQRLLEHVRPALADGEGAVVEEGA